MIIVPVLRTLIFSSLLVLNFQVLAQVYKSTDADGNVIFSDEPSAGSEKVDVPEPNVGDAVKVPESAPEPVPEPKPEIAADREPSNLDGELIEDNRDNGNGRLRRIEHHKRRKHHSR